MDQYHISFKNDQWRYARANSDRVIKTFKTKEDAVRHEVTALKNSKNPASLVIHKKNGDFQMERTYPQSADPRTTKG